MKRTLSLRREQLTELSTAELGSVAGGAPATTPIKYCLTNPSEAFSCYVSCNGSCWCSGEVC